MKKKEHSMQTVGVLLMITVFAASILTVLLAGAGAYRRLTQRSMEGFDTRTAAQYLTERVWQAQTLRTEEFHGLQALCFDQEWNGQAYVTRVYCYDGWLMELFTRAQGDFSPEDGEKLLPLQALELQLTDGLLTAELTDSRGDCRSLMLSVGKEAQP